jgi:hypothetical protein
MKKVEKIDDPDLIYKVENQIKKKFGEETIVDPRFTWTEEKEKKYLEQIKEEFYKKKLDKPKAEERRGFSIKTKLVNKEEDRICIKCKSYSFCKRDDIYLNRFQVCEQCFILYVEGREEKWKEKNSKA